ncbi:aminotransferase-like domain-containing protein [Streptomyces decoyicus]
MTTSLTAPVSTPAPGTLIASRIAALSLSSPYAVPARKPGPDFVNLVSGAPAVEALPLHEIRKVTSELLSSPETGGPALAYGPNAGDPALRELIATREGVDPARVLITNGGLHGTSLALQTVAEPGDVIVVDDPVFPDTIRIVENTGAGIHPVPVGPHGIDVEALAERLRGGLRPKAVYTVPDFHNPNGGLLPYERRLRLVELAEQYGFFVLSDNPYRQFAPDGRSEPDFPFDSDRVVVAHTFAKTLGPGLRLGWLIAPEWLAPHVINLRRRYDFQSSTLSQAIARLPRARRTDRPQPARGGRPPGVGRSRGRFLRVGERQGRRVGGRAARRTREGSGDRVLRRHVLRPAPAGPLRRPSVPRLLGRPARAPGGRPGPLDGRLEVPVT